MSAVAGALRRGLKSGKRRTRRPTVDNTTGRVVSNARPSYSGDSEALAPPSWRGFFLWADHKKETDKIAAP